MQIIHQRFIDMHNIHYALPERMHLANSATTSPKWFKCKASVHIHNSFYITAIHIQDYVDICVEL